MFGKTEENPIKNSLKLLNEIKAIAHPDNPIFPTINALIETLNGTRSASSLSFIQAAIFFRSDPSAAIEVFKSLIKMNTICSTRDATKVQILTNGNGQIYNMMDIYMRSLEEKINYVQAPGGPRVYNTN